MPKQSKIPEPKRDGSKRKRVRLPWRCRTGDCEKVFKGYAPMQRHLDGHGGGRAEIAWDLL